MITIEEILDNIREITHPPLGTLDTNLTPAGVDSAVSAYLRDLAIGEGIDLSPRIEDERALFDDPEALEAAWLESPHTIPGLTFQEALQRGFYGGERDDLEPLSFEQGSSVLHFLNDQFGQGATLEIEDLGEFTRGRYNFSTETIYVDQDLIEHNFERSIATYFHERGHHQQRHPQELDDLASQIIALDNRYYVSPAEGRALHGEDADAGYREYRDQLSELDAEQAGLTALEAAQEFAPRPLLGLPNFFVDDVPLEVARLDLGEIDARLREISFQAPAEGADSPGSSQGDFTAAGAADPDSIEAASPTEMVVPNINTPPTYSI